MSSSRHRFFRRFPRAAAGAALACAGLILTLSVLSVSPHAHETLHPEADSSAHYCAISAFSKGLVDLDSAGGTPLATIPPVAELCRTAEPLRLERSDHRLPLGQAPPDC